MGSSNALWLVTYGDIGAKQKQKITIWREKKE